MAGKIKALALFSGGLDSTLAAKVILDQGIEVEAVYFANAFLSECKRAGHLPAPLGIQLHILDISSAHLEMVKKPRYGYGENMNPCIDCRILMLKEAKRYMQKRGFHFLISGEVLGQRPMSQRKDSLNIIERDAGVKGILLRPLSAKLLKLTLPEEKGWVDREKLFDFSGRSRKGQLALADELNIKEYSAPAGGCLLTEKEFSRKFKDLIASGKFGLSDIQLLKVGRHFRLNAVKCIIGRNEGENKLLLDLAEKGDTLLKMHSFAGPIGLLRTGSSVFTEETIETAAGLIARYSKAKSEKEVQVDYWRKGYEEEKSILVNPASEELIEKWRI
ncbi:MAG: 7-cyano-7-deazaguanine synthase [Candidatus Omnitrophota bacterium]|nr:MAG: 7-cyano-7-deazaguanine synthase [Candidatus Omnitrophota bacterium]